MVDAVASASGDRLFLSLTASDPTYPNCVLVLEPEAGSVERVLTCQTAYAKLAVSDDWQFLYVGAAGYVRRIRLADWQTDLVIGLGVDDAGRAITPDDLQVMPGAPTTIAVARSFMYSTVSNTSTLFDGAVARPISFTTPGFRTQLAFDGTGRHLFVSGSRTPLRLDVLPSGVVLDAPSVPGPSLSTPPNIAWHNGRLYVGKWVWNPDTLAALGSFPDQEPLQDDGQRGQLAGH